MSWLPDTEAQPTKAFRVFTRKGGKQAWLRLVKGSAAFRVAEIRKKPQPLGKSCGFWSLVRGASLSWRVLARALLIFDGYVELADVGPSDLAAVKLDRAANAELFAAAEEEVTPGCTFQD